MTLVFSHDVFLSYNTEDKSRVRRLAHRLKQAGLRVWFDEWSLTAADRIALKQEDEGLSQSRVLLLCISPNAIASGWIALERSTALHRDDPANEGRRFIPLLLADCDLPDTLQRYKIVDFRNETQAALAEILIACRPDSAEALAEKRTSQTIDQKDDAVDQSESLAVLEHTLLGHTGWVRSVVVDPFGKWLVSASADKTVRIWDLETGVCQGQLEGHTNQVRSVAITSDGTRILSASDDGTFRLWSTNEKRELRSWDDSPRQILSISPLADPNQVALIGKNGVLRRWDTSTETSLTNLSVQRIVRGGIVTSDWKCGVVGFDDRLELWDLRTSKCLAILSGHSGFVTSVNITSDGRFAFSGSTDRTIRVWDLQAMTCIGMLEGHGGEVDSLAVSASDTLIASSSFTDKTVRLWDRESGTCLQVIKEKHYYLTPLCVSFSPDGARLVVGTATNTIYTYRLNAVADFRLTEPTRHYVNAKVVLLGEGAVGKTSLAHRLVEDEYVIRDRTHGMNVWRLELPLSPNIAMEREALLWDLAGQEDYRLIHQLFLEETALALLLVNPQKDDPFAETSDWLKALKTATSAPESGREVVRLLIFSQTDVGGMKLGSSKIERFREQHGFGGWLSTSAKTGKNCSDREAGGQPSQLKQLIANNIPWASLPWTNTPRLLVELKNAVVAMRDEGDIRLLRFAELTQRLEQMLPGEEFGKADVRTAVTLLANHGLVRPLKFGDLLLLQPELLNGYAGAIIRAARANSNEIGSVAEAEIYDVAFDFTGVQRLRDRPDEELLLRALVQTFLDRSLCIAEDTPQGRQLIFPSQYRREKDSPRNPETFISYTFSGEWQTVWTTLIVRLWYSQEFEHRELWRNAAEFASPKGYTLGLKIDNQQGEGIAKISLYFDKEVMDELKALFIEYVHRHLVKYGCEVSRDRRYICSECGKSVTDLAEVRKRLDAKKDFIFCQRCDEKVLLVDFIERRLTSDPVARKITAMDGIATRELDTQALEQILIGHMMAIVGEANQIFRPNVFWDYGIDGEVEFKDNDGKASGKKIYIQLKSGNSYLRKLQSDGSEVFDVKNQRHLDYWISQPVDVYLVIRQTDETMGRQTIRWMNITRYLKTRKNKESRQIIFAGEKLDMEAVWKARDHFFPP